MLHLSCNSFTFESTILLNESTSFYKIIARENLCFLMEAKTRLVCSTDLPYLISNDVLAGNVFMKIPKSLTNSFIPDFAKGGIKTEHSPGKGKIVVKKKGG